MRRRLTVAMVCFTAVALLVTSGLAVFLSVEGARSGTRHELAREATSLAVVLQNNAVRGSKSDSVHRSLAALKAPLRLEGSAVVGVGPDGKMFGGRLFGPATLPRGVSAGTIEAAAAHPGEPVTGTHGSLVYAADGFSLNLHTRTGTQTGIHTVRAVVVLTRQAPSGLSGVLPWLLGFIAVVLALAALVAWLLGRRLVAPLEEVERVTARLAAGDLTARVETPATYDPELSNLGEAVNGMAASLATARDGRRRFLLSVSHELRTPLTSIRGYAEALEDGAAPDPAHAGAIIGAEARRLERLVSDLLELARLDAGQFSLTLEDVPLDRAVQAAVSAFGPEAAALDLDLRLGPPPAEGLTVTADPDRLRQVLANLIENALNHAHTFVSVACGVVGGSPALWVVDDGPGIPASELPRVFTRLFSGRHRGRRIGTGIGLAIVAELAGAMGAEVRAESPLRPDGGTRLVVVWSTKVSEIRPLAPSAPERAQPAGS